MNPGSSTPHVGTAPLEEMSHLCFQHEDTQTDECAQLMKYSCFHEECTAESDLGASTAPRTHSAPCEAHEGGASSQALLLITLLISSAGCLLSSCRRHAVPLGREIHHPTSP